MYVFINIICGLYEHWVVDKYGGVVGVVVEGLAMCGLSCSATAQFHLTAKPSSDTTPGPLISKTV